MRFNPNLWFLCLTTSVSSFQILSTTTSAEFPQQVAKLDNNTVFCRTLNVLDQNCSDGEEIECPNGYIFDRKQLICVFSVVVEPAVLCHLSNLPPGNYPNPENCNSFFMLTAGQDCNIMKCASNGLLFSQEKDACLWPLEAPNCCEFHALNISQVLI